MHKGASRGKGFARVHDQARAARCRMRGALSKVTRWLRHWTRRKILVVGASSLAVLLVAVTGTGYVMLRHFNANLVQDDITGLLGSQPVDTHPQAENILV